MTPAERQRDDYERELRYLRHAGAAFARAHPVAAAQLELSADQSPDPHVERLLEGFAFLAARLHRKLDDSVSSLAASLLEQVAPHATRPLPSATVAWLDTRGSKADLAGGLPVPAGTAMFSNVQGDTSIYLRSLYPVMLWPLTVDGVTLHTDRLESHADVPNQHSLLAVTLRAAPGFQVPPQGLGTLRFYVKGENDTAAALCDLLGAHTLAVHWRAHGAAAAHPLAGAGPRFCGLDGAGALLPERADTHPGLRLLLEYLAFPLKFQFFELDCSALAPDALAGGSCELLFSLAVRPGTALAPEPDALLLNCTPLVNLFARTSEPVRVDGTRADYKLVADSLRERATEIFSVEEVAVSAPGEAAHVIAPYFGWHGAGDAQQVFWHARRTPAQKLGLDGSDIVLTLVDPGFDPATPAARTLLARLLCTSRALAATLPAGATLHCEDVGPAAAIRALHKPSAQSQAAPDGAARWKLVAQLSLNQLSLADGLGALASLQELLRLNNLSASVAGEAQIGALRALRCERVTRYVGDDPWQGYRNGYALTLTVDVAAMRGSSVVLFGAVLQQFLRSYAAINTFVELALVDMDGRALQRLPAQSSRQLPL